MSRSKTKRRKKTTRRRRLNLSKALAAYHKARGFHADAFKSYKLSLEAHAAALDRLSEALMSQDVTDPMVDACIRANSGGGSFDDSYLLSNITGLRERGLRICLNTRLDLQGANKFGLIDFGQTVRALKDDAYQRYLDSHR